MPRVSWKKSSSTRGLFTSSCHKSSTLRFKDKQLKDSNMDILIEPGISLLKLEEHLVETDEKGEPKGDESESDEEGEAEMEDEELQMKCANEFLSAATRKILDCISPPREVIKDDQKYYIQVSDIKATRDDVEELGEQLDYLLKVRQARLVGLCPIRRELYEQCFDELIRQSTLCSTERGALLLRIRDELRMTIAAHEALYESGVAYGLRKSLQEECSEVDLDEQVETAEKELETFKERVKELEVMIKQTLKVGEEQKAILKGRHEEKMQYLKKTNEQLRDQLEMMGERA